jgi:transposase
MLCIGIDWADDKHDICILDARDRRRLAELTISHDAAGVAELDQTVAALGYQPADCLVAIETPHGLLVGYLLQQGYVVYAIPPLAVERYRDRKRPSGVKSDTLDAYTMADLLYVDRDHHLPLPADSPLAQEMQLLSRQRQKLVIEQTRLKNQLTACLKAYYPAALKLFSSLEQAITWAFLRTFPNAEAAAQASLADLETFFDQQGYSCKRKVPEIFSKLQAPTIPVATWQVRVYQRQMLLLVDLLATLVPQRKAYEQELHRLLDQHADAFIFRSLPNIGVVTAAWLLGEICDCRDKFPNARSMQALAGTCPITKQSNKVRWVAFRVGCCKPFRNAVQQFARLSARGQKGSPWAKGYLNDQMQRGHTFSRAARALGNRWLVIIFRLWQDQVAYDEKVHLRNRALRGQRVVLELV